MLLCSGHTPPKFRWKHRSSLTLSPGERYTGRSSHVEDIPFPFVVRLSNHERLPRRLASLRVSGAARATEISGTTFPRHFHCSARGTSGGAFTLEDRRFPFVVRLSNHERGGCRFALRPLLRLSSQ